MPVATNTQRHVLPTTGKKIDPFFKERTLLAEGLQTFLIKCVKFLASFGKNYLQSRVCASPRSTQPARRKVAGIDIFLKYKRNVKSEYH